MEVWLLLCQIWPERTKVENSLEVISLLYKCTLGPAPFPRERQRAPSKTWLAAYRFELNGHGRQFIYFRSQNDTCVSEHLFFFHCLPSQTQKHRHLSLSLKNMIRIFWVKVLFLSNSADKRFVSSHKDSETFYCWKNNLSLLFWCIRYVKKTFFSII